MEQTVRERGVLPLGVPLGIFAVLAAVVFLFSRILLNVPRQVAVAVALMTALNILVTCAVFALRRPRGVGALLLLAVIAVPIVIGGAAAAGIVKVKEHKAASAGAAPAGGGTQVATGPIALTAASVAFNKSSLAIAADTPTQVKFKNADTVPHNFNVFQGPAGYAPPATQPPIADPGASVTYDLAPLKAGDYEFRCDLHPGSMKGTLKVVDAKAGGGASPAASGGKVATGPVSLIAASLAFNKSSIDLAANTPTQVKFKNADTAPHNFNINSGPAGYTPPASPKTADPGASVTYDIPALPAGDYEFRCDFHPGSMKGKLTVK